MARQMKDSGIEWIGEIPKSWNTDRLQWHLEEVNVSNSPVQSENILSLTIEAGVIPYEEKGNQGNKSKENYEEYKLAYPDTLVVNSMNVIIGAVGISKYFGCVSPVYYVFRAAEGTSLRYIYYLFTNVGFQKEMRKHAKGILEIRLRISSGDMLKLSIPNPAYEEQQRIAAFLDRKCAEIDAVIERTKATIEEYKKLKQAVITEAVTKGVRGARKMKDSGIEWIGEIPEEWRITRVGRLCFVTKLAGFEFTDHMMQALTEEGDVPIVRAQHIKMGRFLDNPAEYISFAVSQKLSRCALDQRCLIITFIGAGIGEVALFDREQRYHLAPNVAKIVITQEMKKYLSEEYLLYFLMSSAGQEEVNKIKKATAQPSLSMETIRSIKVLIPESKEEQTEIVTYLDEECVAIDNLIAKKAALLTELETYKKSLIYEYVTGKKEVPVAK